MGAIDISDLDAIDAGKLKLELKGSKNFQIDSSGNIKTMQRLDREKISNYKFEIIATDSIKPFNTAKVSFRDVQKPRIWTFWGFGLKCKKMQFKPTPNTLKPKMAKNHRKNRKY